jgi:hypothetical protein
LTGPSVVDLLAELSDDERAEAEAIAQNAPVWMPRPENGPQRIAYASTADVIGYGGAAGGGKTDLGLGLALTRHRNVQVFRREGTELGALIDRCAQILGTRDGLSGRPPVWRSPTSTCDLIEFCSVPHLGDEVAYQGRAKDLLWFDEAANFLEQQVRFLMGWVRPSPGTERGRPDVLCQTLLTFNPPTTVEGRWIVAFFAPWLDKKHPNPAKSGEIRWFATIDDKEREVDGPGPVTDSKGRKVRPMSRTFIAARVGDNPDLANSTQYLATLDGLPEPLRSLMRDGDFAAAMQDDTMQVIPTAWVEAAMARWKPQNPMPEMDSVGVDVAMGGRDNTEIARRHAHWFDKPIVYEGHRCPDGPTIAGYVTAAQRDRAPIHIDLFGVGAEPYGHLMRAQAPVLGISMGEKTGEIAVEGRRRFFNIRSMLWWRMREALNPTNPLQIDLPPDRMLLADLCAPKWEERAGGIIYVQSRDEIVATIGRSPDRGTAYILALMNSPALRGRGAGWEEREKPYDPLDSMDDWRKQWKGKA